MRNRVILFFIILLLPFTFGWANGDNSGNGYGTHDWLMFKAWDALGRPDWVKYKTSIRSTDDPDTAFKDFKYHAYDRWGASYGFAPLKVRALFDQAVDEYLNADNKALAVTIGRMSHYFTDINNPLHTDASPAENQVHRLYERAVGKTTNYGSRNDYPVNFDGRDYIRDPAQYTRDIAAISHGEYAALVKTLNEDGFSRQARSITKRRLNRAANGLADLMYSIRKKATKVDRPRIAFETTKGRFVVRLFPKDAPFTVANFVKLADQGFYDGLTFHRYVPGFVIQGGDPKGDGTGGPGYAIPAEFNSRPHQRGTLAMARGADPDSAGSQFYIALTRAQTQQLDGQYTVFGQVVKGMSVVDKLRADDIMNRVYVTAR